MGNPLENLLDALPAAIAREKRAAIQSELEAVGMWNHYSQNISKPGRDVGKITMHAARVFVGQLGLSYEFFTGNPEEQEEETRRIVRRHYDQLLSAV